MGSFNTYLRLGFDHITAFAAIDHMLFLLALIAIYQPKNWLKVFWAISIFTLAHSISLIVSAFDIFTVDKALIEFLIPVTIAFTSLFNLSSAGQNQNSKMKYWLSLVFGLIHGFGFSNYYSILVTDESNFWQALLPFNLGVELGQLVIVAIILFLIILFQNLLRIKRRDWILIMSGVSLGISLLMCLENWPF